MPKDCRECLMGFRVQIGCNVKRHDFTKRPDGCPLIEIAEPHGRIIDESQISEATRWRGGYEMSMSGYEFETDAPTLIEREG